MKFREALLGGLSILAGAGVINDYLLKRDICNKPVVRGYNGLQEQINYLDGRIENENLDSYSAQRLVETRDSIIQNKDNFYFENRDELLEARDDIRELDNRQWLLLGIAGLGLAGFVLSRRFSKN